jgi:plasmid stabilization system protein ParE
MKVIFSELSKIELADAVEYYDLKQPGLGKRFKAEVRQSIFRIVQYPKAWSAEKGEIRKCLLHKFSYKILYSIESDHIFIVAIAHQHRKPNYWIDTLLPFQ